MTCLSSTSLVSVITVNYNGYADTCEMIESFRKYENYPAYEIIVVDNGSKRSEAKELQLKFPNIKVLENSNTGFAGGNNAGLQVAEGEYCFFINNDTFIEAPVIAPLVQRLQDKTENGGVSPMLKFAEQPDTLQYAGFTPLTTITLRNASIGFMEKDQLRFHTAMETASLHGAAMMIKREVIEQVGTMPEIYFLFYEELDWSAQMLRSGYKLWYEPTAIVYHKEAMTARKESPLREFYLSRARMIYARRNVTGFSKLLSCCYTGGVAAPKKVMLYLLHRKPELAKAVIQGTYRGLTCHVNT